MWEGPGLHNIVVGTDPAAGVECSDNISPAFVRLVSWFGVLVTSAAVANREVELILDDGGTPLVIHAGGGNVVHTASRTLFYTAAAGLPAGLLRSDVVGIPLPTHARFGPGLRVRTATLNLQAGDNWAAPNLTLERLVHLT